MSQTPNENLTGRAPMPRKSIPVRHDPYRLNPSLRRTRLIELMALHDLTAAQTAAIVGRTPEHVRAWRNGRVAVPEPSLRLLELELGTRTPAAGRAS